jgi:hypothetical protein
MPESIEQLVAELDSGSALRYARNDVENSLRLCVSARRISFASQYTLFFGGKVSTVSGLVRTGLYST